jgi:hypothetical protein
MITVFEPVLVIRSVLDDPERDCGLESDLDGYLESRDEEYRELELDRSRYRLCELSRLRDLEGSLRYELEGVLPLRSGDRDSVRVL